MDAVSIIEASGGKLTFDQAMVVLTAGEVEREIDLGHGLMSSLNIEGRRTILFVSATGASGAMLVN